MATSWATSQEKSYRISMPRCLPSAPEWIPGVTAATAEGATSTSSSRNRRNSRPSPRSSQLYGRTDVATKLPLPSSHSPPPFLSPSPQDFVMQSRIKILLAYTCSPAPLGAHMCSHAQLGLLARCTHKVSRKSFLWPTKGFLGEFEVDIFFDMRIPLQRSFSRIFNLVFNIKYVMCVYNI